MDGWVKSPLGQALAGVQVYVCNQPADAAFVPPEPLASVYADPAGAVPIVQPIITDGFGHYDFYALSGFYTVVIVNAGNVQNMYADQTVGLPGVSSGSVGSVFGRTGNVLAQTGDYTVSQITGAAPTTSPSFTGTADFVNVALSGTLADGTSSIGSSGQVLSSTGSGTEWVTIGSGSSVPSLSSFTFINQGSSTAKQTVANGPIQMSIADNASLNWRILSLATPSTPYKFIAQLRGVMATPENSQTVGFYFYDGTKLEGIEFLSQSAGFLPRVQQLNSVTSAGSTPYSGPTQSFSQPVHPYYSPMWLQLRNNGSTLYFDYSFDGTNFVNVYSESVGSFITPTAVGFGGVSAVGSTTSLLSDLISWSSANNANL
jgi:hypothetical protein